MIDIDHKWNVSSKPLIWGLILSVILTLLAYFIVVGHDLSNGSLMLIILGIGIIQAFVQFAFFLHVFIESKPRWNLMVFLFMILIIVVLVGGSLWIMHNLDYNVMLKGKH